MIAVTLESIGAWAGILSVVLVAIGAIYTRAQLTQVRRTALNQLVSEQQARLSHSHDTLLRDPDLINIYRVSLDNLSALANFTEPELFKLFYFFAGRVGHYETLYIQQRESRPAPTLRQRIPFWTRKLVPGRASRRPAPKVLTPEWLTALTDLKTSDALLLYWGVDKHTYVKIFQQRLDRQFFGNGDPKYTRTMLDKPPVIEFVTRIKREGNDNGATPVTRPVTGTAPGHATSRRSPPPG